MRAIQIDGFDAPLRVREIDTPSPRSGEVLLRVRAAGVNAADWRLWHGEYRSVQEHRFPITLGFDMAGVVDRLGERVETYRGGEEVYGSIWKPLLLDGTFADYVVSPAGLFFGPKPASLDFAEAAAVPMSGTTALVALDALRPRAGETLLVVGATGAVGGFATQLASREGVKVIATSRRSDVEYLRGLGAAETVDYTQGNFVEALRAKYPRGIDTILDVVSSAAELSRIAALLHKGGRVVPALFAADAVAYRARGIEATNINTPHDPGLLERLRKLIDREHLRTPMARTYPLEQAAAALSLGEKGHPSGRVVLIMG